MTQDPWHIEYFKLKELDKTEPGRSLTFSLPPAVLKLLQLKIFSMPRCQIGE